MQTVSMGDNFHEMSNPVFWKKLEKYFNVLSAENFTKHAKHYADPICHLIIMLL